MSNRSHGVYDSGAVGGGVEEADITLLWGLAGKHILTQNGIAVYMTRDDATDHTPVSSRDNRAEQAGATRFISIHCNSATPSATGTETFYRDAKDKEWARIVQDAALHAMGLRDRGLKTEAQSQHTRLGVFNFDGPCCLLELGFISSAKDRAAMLKRENRVAFWSRIAQKLTEVMEPHS